MGLKRLPLLLPVLGMLALLAMSEVGAQQRRGPADDQPPPGSRGENFSAGRPPAQLFQSDCTGAGCHSNPRGLVKNYSSSGLAGFLREHYTNSRESAAALAGYLMSAGPADRSGRPQPPGSIPQQQQQQQQQQQPQQSQQQQQQRPPPRSAARSDEPATELLRPEPGRPGAAEPGRPGAAGQAAPGTPAGRPTPANRRGRPGAEQSEAAAPPSPASAPPAAAPQAPAAAPAPPAPSRPTAPPPPRQFDIFD